MPGRLASKMAQRLRCFAEILMANVTRASPKLPIHRMLMSECKQT